MRIGMNLIPLRPGHMGGAEVYFRDLLAELLKRGGHQYVLVTADYNHDTLPGDSPACRRILFLREAHAAGRPRRWLARALATLRRGVNRVRAHYGIHVPEGVRDLLRPLVLIAARAAGRFSRAMARLTGRRGQRHAEGLRELIRREAIDLWFCPFTNLEPRVSPVPGVITVYDLQHEYFPEFFDPNELRHRRHFYPESCAGADHIIAISEFTRRCVMERYGVAPEHVSAISLAAGSDFAWRDAPARSKEVRRRHGLPARYVLYPANTWHHKNHVRLIEALAHYRRKEGEALTLVLTGVSKEGQPGLMAAMEDHGLTGLVRVLGFVPRADLPALYAGAACLVLPSLFEGFGIPLVEAMLVGCPIAAADVASIPEVAGDAAVLFDPLDPVDIARAIAAILRDPDRAAELARRGRARAELFSASRMAERTVELFERVHREGLVSGRGAGREQIAVDGVWDDQWMGHEAVVALRGRALVSLEIEGELVAIGPLLPQRLVARVGGHEAAALSLPAPGPFSLTVPLLPDGGATGAWEISLVSERTFRPQDFGPAPDPRDLSVRLLRLRVRTHDGREIVKTLGSAPEPRSAT